MLSSTSTSVQKGKDFIVWNILKSKNIGNDEETSQRIMRILKTRGYTKYL